MSDWIKRDLAVNWHPDTQMQSLQDDPPLLLSKAQGRMLYDAEGRGYYDTISSWWCNVHGHGHPRLRLAAERQMAELDHVLFGAVTHQPAIMLAEELIKIAPPGISRIFYSDDGSTAVEVALKMSLQYWQQSGQAKKCRFISFDHGYHGDTVGCMSVSGVQQFNGPFAPLLFPSYKIAFPNCSACQHNIDCSHAAFGRDAAWQEDSAAPLPQCLQPLQAMLEQKSHEIAAFILEPLLLGAGGMKIYPPAYLRGAAKLLQRYQVHLILDEVATGFGRIGPMFACELAGISPDMLCISKGLTGGMMPLAATLTTTDIYTAFLGDDSRAFYHGHTYTANPIGCAIALASLEIFREDNLLDQVAKIAPMVQAGMKQFTEFPGVKEYRGLGMVAALELAVDAASDDHMNTNHRIMRRIYHAGLDAGLLLRPLANVSYLFLAQSTTEAEVTDIFQRLDTVYRQVLTP